VVEAVGASNSNDATATDAAPNEVVGLHAPRAWRRDRDDFLASLHHTPFDVVVLCTPDQTQVDLAAAAMASGAHVVATADSLQTRGQFSELDDLARQHGLSVVVGAAMSPALSTVLALHAATLFDPVLAVSVGLAGFWGKECRERRRLVRTDAIDIRAGEEIRYPKGSGREVLFFPDPLGGLECERDDFLDAVEIFGALTRRENATSKGTPENMVDVSVRVVTTPVVRGHGHGRGVPAESGGLRVEVSGRTARTLSSVVYGLVGDPVDLSAIVSAVAARRLVRGHGPTGVIGVHELGSPKELLADFIEAGIAPMVYEGPD
jgi:hypothetical protein